AVSPGCASYEQAVFVSKAEGNAIELEFSNIFIRFVPEDLFDPLVKISKLFLGIGIAQRQHGILVVNRGELFGNGAAHPLGWRIRRTKFRESSFQSNEFFQ